MKIFYFIFGLMVTLFWSCSTEVDISGERQDLTIVYGLLCPNDNIQYIRISRAFVGEGNAYDMAKNNDSASYGNDLEVFMQEYIDGILKRTIVLDTVLLHTKSPGVFNSPDYIAYKTIEKIYSDREYKLFIRNKKTNKEITSSTKTMGDFSIYFPLRNPYHEKIALTNAININWSSAKFGKLYEVKLRFYYTEERGGIEEQKVLEFYVGGKTSSRATANEKMEMTLSAEAFYNYLSNKLSSEADVIRHPGKIGKRDSVFDFIIGIADEQFQIYSDLSKPSSGLVQEKPDYTNIINGIGLFASRVMYVIPNKGITEATLDTLCRGRITNSLNFQ